MAAYLPQLADILTSSVTTIFCPSTRTLADGALVFHVVYFSGHRGRELFAPSTNLR